jgi:hypothetical protein
MFETKKPIPITRLSEIQQHFLAAVPRDSGDVSFNLALSFRFRHHIIRDDSDLPRLAEAQEWQALQPNKFLYFTHGQYANRDSHLAAHQSFALDHIVRELKRKPTSRRALFSLLHTGDIVDTGDKPIPSLVLFQCGMVQDELIATTYFRALEVKQFLLLNVAEFALWARYLRDSHLSFDWITWTIYAFQAYAEAKSNCLRKPEAAASYGPIQIAGIASRRDYAALAELLRGFTCREAYLSRQAFEWLCDGVQEFIPGSSLVPGLLAARDVLRVVEEGTRTHSFGEDLDRLIGGFIKMAEELFIEATRLARDGRG